jgi:hypothetical protein
MSTIGCDNRIDAGFFVMPNCLDFSKIMKRIVEAKAKWIFKYEYFGFFLSGALVDC